MSSFEDQPPHPAEVKRSLSNESGEREESNQEMESRMNAENDRLNQSLPSAGFKRGSYDDPHNGTYKQRNPSGPNLPLLRMPVQQHQQMPYHHVDTPQPQYNQQHPMRAVHSKSFPGMNTRSLDRKTERRKKNAPPPNLADVTEEERKNKIINSYISVKNTILI